MTLGLSVSKLLFPGTEAPFPIVSLICNKDNIFVLFLNRFRTQRIEETFLSPLKNNPNT